MRPQKPRGPDGVEPKDSRKDVVSQLVRLNLQRTLHELCCGREEGIVPIPNFIKKLKEQDKWMTCRKEKPLNIDEALRSPAPNSPVTNPGSAQKPIRIEDDAEEETNQIQTGSATNAPKVPTASNELIETSEQPDTEPAAMEV